jgi:prepilin-type N-terminal cleavage/methylation domain-containing protein
MRAPISYLYNAARQESGFSLIELMVAITLSGVVLGIAFTGLASTARTAPKETERAKAISEAQVGLARMVRELRQAYDLVSPVTSDKMHVKVRLGGQNREIVYSCEEPHPTLTGLYRCLRWEVTGGVAGPKEVVIDRLLNGPTAAIADRPFHTTQPAGATTYVKATVWASAKGETTDGYKHKIVLNDGFFMRNCREGC